MAKHRRSTRKGKDKRSHGAPLDQRQRGMQAFRAGRLDEAIALWSASTQQDAQLVAALAEAHFRRALMRRSGEEQVGDLRRAMSLAPDDLRYRYHLGLALHRIGDLAGAVECYRDVLQRDVGWPGAGTMLGLATLEQDPRADLGALPGNTAEVLRTLAPVEALLRGKVPEPDGEDPLAQLWRGLGLVQTGDAAGRENLGDTRPLPSRQAAAARRYYQGVAAAQAGDVEAALTSWQELHDQGMRTPWLLQNLAAVVFRHVRDLGGAGDIERATTTAQRWLSLAASSPALGDALVRALDQGAQAAAAGGDWARAAELWEGARQIISSSSGLGSPRPLLHNLALAHEAQEHWLDAADAWRAMLRTRPRGTARDRKGKTPAPSAPGDLTEDRLGDAQWSWVRSRVIECYKRAGEPGEAVAIFRQAIKADPDDLDLRLQLADALLSNEQDQAAINELQRLLQIAPEHVEARLRLAGAQMARGYWYVAEHILREVMDQYPDNADARWQMTRLLLERGQYLLNVGLDDAAAPLFEEGQRLAPEDYRFPLNLARVAIDDGKREQARSLLERTLALGGERSVVYLQVIECWAVLGDIDEARAVLGRAEAALPLTSDFYVSLGLLLLRRTTTSPSLLSPYAESPSQPADTPWSQLAQDVLDRAVAREPDNGDLHTQIALDLLSIRPDLMLRYAEQAVQRSPDDARSLMVSGLALALNDRTDEAKDTLRRASNLARRQGDTALARDIDSMRQQVGSPLLRLALSMGPLVGDSDLDDDVFP